MNFTLFLTDVYRYTVSSAHVRHGSARYASALVDGAMNPSVRRDVVE